MELRERIGQTNFVWAEFLYLPKWDIHGYPNETVSENIIKTANALNRIRSYYNKKVFITSGWRPDVYNKLIGGAPNSYHIKGLAVDFYVDGISCDQVRKDMEPKLEEWRIRMEDEVGVAKVHIDLGPVTFNRFFKPYR